LATDTISQGQKGLEGGEGRGGKKAYHQGRYTGPGKVKKRCKDKEGPPSDSTSQLDKESSLLNVQTGVNRRPSRGSRLLEHGFSGAPATDRLGNDRMFGTPETLQVRVGLHEGGTGGGGENKPDSQPPMILDGYCKKQIPLMSLDLTRKPLEETKKMAENIRKEKVVRKKETEGRG